MSTKKVLMKKRIQSEVQTHMRSVREKFIRSFADGSKAKVN